MSVNLIIDGKDFELKGAATEATLRDLLDKMSAGKNVDTKNIENSGKKLGDMAKSAESFTLDLDAATDKVDTFSEELDDAADAASSFSSKAGNFVKKLIDGASQVVQFGSSTAGVGYSLETMGKNADSVLSSFPVIGSLLGAAGGAMIGHAANLQDTFRGLSSTGAMFSDSFFELERVAATSYLSLAEMTSIVRSNSEALAAFGGSTRLGAKRFAEMNMVMQQTYRTELREFGLSAADSAEMLAIFTAANARNAQFSTMTTQQQAAAGANFAKEMTLLASLTGQDRKAMAEKLAQDQRRSDVELKMSRMSGEAQTRARAAFNALEQQFGANSPVLEAFRAKFLGQDVVIGNPAANMLLAGTQPIGAALNDVATKLASGSISVDQVVKSLASSAQAQIDANKNLEATAPFNQFSMEMTNISAGALKLAKMQQTVNEKFSGDYAAFLEASNQPQLDQASKAIVATGMLAEDIGKNTRLLFNALTETTVSGIATGVKKLSDTLGGMTSEELSKLETSAAAATGATASLAVFAQQAADKLKHIAKLSAAGGGSTVATAAKSVAAGGAGMGANLLKKVPILGALLTGGVTFAESKSEGESTSRAATKAVGSAGGSFAGGMAGAGAGAKIGAMIGTVGGPVGMAIGGIIGGILGGVGGSILGQKAGEAGGEMVSDAAGFEEGGIVRQPTLAMIGEGQSDEAVIPLENNRNVPVNMDMSAIEELSRKIDRLASSAGGGDPSMTMEMRKFNRNAEKMVRLLQ